MDYTKSDRSELVGYRANLIVTILKYMICHLLVIYSNDTIVSRASSLAAWWEFLKINRTSLVPCKLSPIWNNPDILLNRKIIHFTAWYDKGIRRLEHIIQDNHVISFDRIVEMYNIEKNKYLEYLQVKSVIQNKLNIKESGLELSPKIADFLTISRKKNCFGKYMGTC